MWKTTLIVIVCFLFCTSAFAPTLAVQKREKTPATEKGKAAEQVKHPETKADTQSSQAKSTQENKKVPATTKQDDFLDANKNGIDDRLEKSTLVPQKKPEPAKTVETEKKKDEEKKSPTAKTKSKAKKE